MVMYAGVIVVVVAVACGFYILFIRRKRKKNTNKYSSVEGYKIGDPIMFLTRGGLWCAGEVIGLKLDGNKGVFVRPKGEYQEKIFRKEKEIRAQ